MGCQPLMRKTSARASESSLCVAPSSAVAGWPCCIVAASCFHRPHTFCAGLIRSVTCSCLVLQVCHPGEGRPAALQWALQREARLHRPGDRGRAGAAHLLSRWAPPPRKEQLPEPCAGTLLVGTTPVLGSAFSCAYSQLPCLH